MVNGDDHSYKVQYVIPVYENWGNDNNGNTGGGAGGAGNVQETKHQFIICEKVYILIILNFNNTLSALI